MLHEAMRTWCRPVFLLFFLPLGLALFSNCYRMLQELLSKKDLLIAFEPLMCGLGVFQIVTGILIFSSTCFLICVLLTRNSKLLKHGLVSQQTSAFICIAIMGLVLFTRYPSLKTDENLLNNAMSGYGKDDSMTKMMDTTQSELKCCGVTEFADWKRINVTFIVPALSYELAGEAMAIVPFTCAAINETSVRFYTGGCLVPFFAFKEYMAYRLLMNAEILVYFEMFILFLVGSIIVTDTMESNKEIHVLLMNGIIADLVDLDAAADAKSRQGEDVPSIYTLYAPPMPLEV